MLAIARPHHPISDRRRRLGGAGVEEFFGFEPGDLNVNIDAVHQRPADLACIAGAGGGTAYTFLFRIALEAARARIHCPDEDALGGESHRALHAGDGYDRVLERLAQRLQDSPIKLGHLVHEEAALVGHADLAWLWVLASADDSGVAGAVVGGAEGAFPDEASFVSLAVGAVDAGDGDALL